MDMSKGLPETVSNAACHATASASLRGSAVVLVIALSASACTGGGAKPPPPRPNEPLAVAGIRLYPSPRIALEACQQAQSLTSRTVLCPGLLPRPVVSSSSEPGVPPQPIGVVVTDDPSLLASGTGPGSVLLSVIYSAPYENDPSKNRPDRFLHFEVYVRGECCGPPPSAKPAVLGGKQGLLVRAGGAGAYFYNHVRFFWKQNGIDYVATLHEFGAGTTALLGALVAGLQPVGATAIPTTSPAEGRLSVPVPDATGPVAVVVEGGSVWIASIGDAASAYQTAAWPGRQTGPGLQRFDATTLKPEGGPIRLGGPDLREQGLIPRVDWRPSGLASAFGKVWTIVETYPESAVLFGLDAATGRIAARFPEQIPLSTEGDVTGISATAGALWVSLYGPPTSGHRGEFGGIYDPGSVWRFDPSTGIVTARIRVGAGAVSVVGTSDGVWVANYLDDTVSRIDPSTNRVIATVPVGAGPSALATTSEDVWVTNSIDGTVCAIDADTDRVVATIAVGDGPMGVAASADGVWVTNYLSDTVSVIDPGRNRVIATWPTGRGPIGVAEQVGRLWITNDLDATLTARAVATPHG
jgi:YVTN family beta-propeller protein